MTKNQTLRQLNDYEVLGVAALRRHQLLSSKVDIELVLHPELVAAGQSAIYEAHLRETLAWLKPLKVSTAASLASPKDEFLLEVLLEVLRAEYPRSSEYLKSDVRELLSDYLQEVPWQGPLLSAHFRYWPVFLKRRFRDSRLYLIAQREWIGSFLSFADFGSAMRDPGHLQVNPSLQSLYTDQEVPEVQLAEGLTVFFYHSLQKVLSEHKMDLWEAALVDLLQEDRKFNLDQLLDQVLMMELDIQLSREEWQKKIDLLQYCGIIQF